MDHQRGSFQRSSVERNAGTLQRPVSREKSAGRMPRMPNEFPTKR